MALSDFPKRKEIHLLQYHIHSLVSIFTLKWQCTSKHFKLKRTNVNRNQHFCPQLLTQSIKSCPLPYHCTRYTGLSFSEIRRRVHTLVFIGLLHDNDSSECNVTVTQEYCISISYLIGVTKYPSISKF